MTTTSEATVHASCVLVGRRAVLIRGPSGSGKSRLALALLEASRSGRAPPAWLVADDRVRLRAAGGRLVAEAPESIRGRMEVRGAGIHAAPCEPLALVGLVVDLAASDAARMPERTAGTAAISGVTLSRLPVAAGTDALPLVLAALSTVTQA